MSGWALRKLIVRSRASQLSPAEWKPVTTVYITSLSALFSLVSKILPITGHVGPEEV
jgi:hypothetical protein